MSDQNEQEKSPLIIINGNIPGWFRQHRKLVLCSVLMLCLAAFLFFSPAGPSAGSPAKPSVAAKAPAVVGDAPTNGAQFREDLLGAANRGANSQSELTLAEQRIRALNGNPDVSPRPAQPGTGQLSQSGSGQPQSGKTQGNTGGSTQAQPKQDSGFLTVSADGKNSSQSVMTQQEKEVQGLIEKQKALLKQSIDSDPVAKAPAEQSEPRGPSLSVPPQEKAGDPRYNEPAKLAVLPAAPGYYRISLGRDIPCILLNRIEGEYAGPVKCTVSVPVMSDDDRHVLIPRGSVIIGEAGEVSGQQQKRISVSFHRLEIFQHDRSVISYDLDKFTGLDQAGATALGGKVNTHMLSAMMWSLPLGGLAALSMAGTSLGAGYSGTDAMRMGITQSESQTAQQVLGRKTQAFPTITVHEGTRIEIFTSKDIDLPEYKEQ